MAFAGWTMDGRYAPFDPGDVIHGRHTLGLPPCPALERALTIFWPAGPAPSRISLIFTRKQIVEMGMDGLHTVTMGFNEKQLTFKNLVALGPAVCVLGGGAGFDGSLYLLELGDLRHTLLNAYYGAPSYSQYNVGAASTGVPGDYYEETMRVSTTGTRAPYTWQEILDHLWQQMQPPDELGSSPALPFTPHGIPQNLRYAGVPAWAAYNEVLMRLRCQFVVRPDGTCRIVQCGVEDPLYRSAVEKYNIPHYWTLDEDEDPLETLRGKVASRVDVLFRRVWQHYGTERTTEWRVGMGQPTTDPIHRVRVSCPLDIASRVQQNSTAFVWDDLPAIVDPEGGLVNASLLDDRAAERAADYYRTVYSGGQKLKRTYLGLLMDEGFWPSSSVSSVTWSYKGAARTTVYETAHALRENPEGGGCMCDPFMDSMGENFRGPDLGRFTVPNYPLTDQVVRVTQSSPVGNGLYLGKLAYCDPRYPRMVDLHDVVVFDPNQS